VDKACNFLLQLVIIKAIKGQGTSAEIVNFSHFLSEVENINIVTVAPVPQKHLISKSYPSKDSQ
jgi:hypothetical protein